MNSAVIARQANTRFFFISVAVVLTMLVLSGFFIRSIFATNGNGVAEAKNSCIAALRSNGFQPNPTEGGVEVSRGMTNDIEAWVTKSGVIIAGCPSYTLTEYCAGNKCAKPGLSFNLKQKD